jgi:hypothetical protein
MSAPVPTAAELASQGESPALLCTCRHLPWAHAHHGLQGSASSDRNAVCVLRAVSHGRPVSAAALIPVGGRPAVDALLAAGYVKRHRTHYLVITQAGLDCLAG